MKNSAITESELDRIKERLKGITPGPWKADYGNWEIESENEETSRDSICSFAPSDRTRVDGTDNPIHFMDDAEFIAHARSDIPRLIEEIERLKDQLIY